MDRNLEALLQEWRDACFDYLPERAAELAANLRTALQKRQGPVEIDDLFEEIDAGVGALQLRPAESVPVRRRLSELALAYQPSGGSDMEIDFDPFNSESWTDEESLVAALFAMAEPGEREKETLLETPGFVTPLIGARVGPRRQVAGFEAPSPTWELREKHKGFSLRQGLGVVRRVELETERLKADAALCIYVAAATLYRQLEPKKRQIRDWRKADLRLTAEMEARLNRGEEPILGISGLAG